jgi:hypothetical protein
MVRRNSVPSAFLGSIGDLASIMSGGAKLVHIATLSGARGQSANAANTLVPIPVEVKVMVVGLAASGHLVPEHRE